LLSIQRNNIYPTLSPFLTASYWPLSLPPAPPSVPASTVIPLPNPKTNDTPAPAPKEMTGDWQSQQLLDNYGQGLKGGLIVSRKDGLPQILKIADFPLPLGEGSLVQFLYTPTIGDAPISIKARFYSGYTIELTGTAKNHLCPLNGLCGLAGYFHVEGRYVVREGRGLIVDKGTFNLYYPESMASFLAGT